MVGKLNIGDGSLYTVILIKSAIGTCCTVIRIWISGFLDKLIRKFIFSKGFFVRIITDRIRISNDFKG